MTDQHQDELAPIVSAIVKEVDKHIVRLNLTLSPQEKAAVYKHYLTRAIPAIPEIAEVLPERPLNDLEKELMRNIPGLIAVCAPPYQKRPEAVGRAIQAIDDSQMLEFGRGMAAATRRNRSSDERSK